MALDSFLPTAKLVLRRPVVTRTLWFSLGIVGGLALSFRDTTLHSSAPPMQQAEEKDAYVPSPEVLAELEHALKVPATSIVAVPATAPTVRDEAPLPVVAAKPRSGSFDLEVQSGDTLISMLTGNGVSAKDSYEILRAIRKVYNPRDLTIGQNVTLIMDGSAAPTVKTLKIEASPDKVIEVARKSDGTYGVKEVALPVEKKLVLSSATIRSSLYQDGVESGLPMALMDTLIKAFSYDVDFQRDIKSGDRLEVAFERYYTEDGEVVRNGNVVYAELTTAGRPIRLYRYTDANGVAEFYNEKGESLRKALLRTPIEGARITSKFGLRVHPLLGYTRAHKGVDFGAPQGTPIYAAGDGVVEFVGRKNGYGNYVRVRHNTQYATAYAHASRFAGNLKPGTRVKQGQVIAYVGMTGRTTGPHLHFEVLANNRQINPGSAKFQTNVALSGKNLTQFKAFASALQSRLASMPRANQQASAAGKPVSASN